ncbi:MAG TPA: NAD-dependent DNA ligase LigA [Bacteroidia bacterium]|nr:NAD-dependent DNA ligase LigA [Bacteroidia bacterium]HRH09589.1 NAD-dependent DNA ligase LigA [Bacteroidia bacterium]HRH63862.1 NAD-dependent DNA ligase LigA [Bacteroidia bacterium]
MTSEEAKLKIDDLSATIEEHNYKYYILSSPSISDFEFDSLLNELIAIEKQFPEHLRPNSPTQRVGGGITKEFKTVVHTYPMLSLGNTYSQEEIADFDNRIRKVITDDFEYVCELKFDGVAIGLTYKNGELSRAVTRGDGVQGDDVTTNVRTIKTIPLRLSGKNFPDEFEIRGEIFMPHASFEAINKEREEIDEAPLANPRNAASGSLKIQDSTIVAKRNLDCFLYAIYGENLPFSTHAESLKAAKEWGFKTSPHTRVCKSLEEVTLFINHWNEERNKLDFDIDGIVLKVNHYKQQQVLGFTSKTPRWAISFKFKAEQASTQLISIVYQVGRTGAITPVANLQPVLLAGTVVKRASLHNADIIEKLDIRVGDTVFVEKGGEIIPKIIGVDLSKRSTTSVPTNYAEQCPECGTQLIRREGEANHYCPNELGCAPQIKGKIEHFVSRKAMNIDSLGAETIEQLFDAMLIFNCADIYDLKEAQLLRLERMAQKSVNNLLQGIELSKKVPFERVLYALGIRHVGETVAKKIAYNFKSMDGLLTHLDQLEQVDEIGPRITQSIKDYFADPRNLEIIHRLKSHGLKFELTEEQTQHFSDKLKGLSFVVSGVFSKFNRDDVKKLIEQNGGKNVGSISAKTSYVLAGENMGPAKLEKAEKLGVKIINEDDFLALIHDNQ